MFTFFTVLLFPECSTAERGGAWLSRFDSVAPHCFLRSLCVSAAGSVSSPQNWLATSCLDSLLVMVFKTDGKVRKQHILHGGSLDPESQKREKSIKLIVKV